MISSCCYKLEYRCISFTSLLPISSLPATFLFLILQFPTWPFRTVVLHLIASLDLISAKNNLLVVYHPVCAKGNFWDHFGDVATSQEDFNTLVLSILLGNLLQYLKMLQDTKTSRSTTLFRMDQHLQIVL